MSQIYSFKIELNQAYKNMKQETMVFNHRHNVIGLAKDQNFH